MGTLLLLLVIATSGSAPGARRDDLSATSAPGPVIEMSGGGFGVRLPRAFARAIEEAAPGFRPFTLDDYADDIRHEYTFTMRQAPWAVVGDFNGDGWCDLVIDGHDATSSYRFCVWGGAAPKVLKLAPPAPRQGGVLIAALQYHDPGRVETNFNNESMELFTDGFNDYAWEKAGTLFFWKKDHFEQFVTSD